MQELNKYIEDKNALNFFEDLLLAENDLCSIIFTLYNIEYKIEFEDNKVCIYENIKNGKITYYNNIKELLLNHRINDKLLIESYDYINL